MTVSISKNLPKICVFNSIMASGVKIVIPINNVNNIAKIGMGIYILNKYFY
jgi:hypothetical protein